MSMELLVFHPSFEVAAASSQDVVRVNRHQQRTIGLVGRGMWTSIVTDSGSSWVVAKNLESRMVVLRHGSESTTSLFDVGRVSNSWGIRKSRFKNL